MAPRPPEPSAQARPRQGGQRDPWHARCCPQRGRPRPLAHPIPSRDAPSSLPSAQLTAISVASACGCCPARLFLGPVTRSFHFPPPGAAPFQPSGHPLLFGWRPHISIQVTPPWAAGPQLYSHWAIASSGELARSQPVFMPLICHSPGLPSYGQQMALDPEVGPCLF